MGRPPNSKNKPKAVSIMPPMEDDGQDRAGTEVAIFQPARLPYHHAIEERFGVDKGQWKVLVEAIFPAAKTIDSVVMVLSYCKTRNLDPFKRPVHIVPMWDSAKGGYVETVWPGISELRTTASRTKGYAGCDEAEFGPEKTTKIEGRVKRNSNWETETVSITFPEWCRLTLYRIVDGQRCKFVGPKVKWLETYATQGASDLPNKMWQERPEGQLEKCAEAAALRRAFPEEIGNELTAEEMIGRNVHDLSVDIPVADIATHKDSGPPRTLAPADTKIIEMTVNEPSEPEPVRDGTPPRPDPISSGPPRQAAPKPEPKKTADAFPQPHKIPGTGETYESWAEKYCDLLKTSPDKSVFYKWMDLNSEPLGRLNKGKPSVAAKVHKITENTLQGLRDAAEKADAKAAKKTAPSAEMDEPSFDELAGGADGPPMDPEAVLKFVNDTLAAVTSPDDLQDVYTAKCEPQVETLSFPGDKMEAAAIYQRHEKRLGID